MKLTIIGTGYVGLVTGVCFSELGFNITCVDKNKERIETLKSGEVPIFEPNLSDYLRRNIKLKRLNFTAELKNSVSEAAIVFITVGTPYNTKTRRSDLVDLFSLLEALASSLDDYKVIVMKSTVPIGTTKHAADYLRILNPGASFDVVSNPEFLREGSAIQDFMQPDRIVVGVESLKAKMTMRKLYESFISVGIPFLEVGLETAELIKYAANAFLGTKIAFINQIADLCEKCNSDIGQVAKGIGLDHRIGKEFLTAGPGFGGSCFPKDMQTLIQTGHDVGVPLTIIETAFKSNQARKNKMINRIESAIGGFANGKTLAILGLTFKANTDDLRESPSLTIIPALCAAGVIVKAYDPKGMPSAHAVFPEIIFANSAYEAIHNADAILILTEWDEFKVLDLQEVKKLLKQPIIIDLRNIFSIEEMSAQGLIYHSLGRPSLA